MGLVELFLIAVGLSMDAFAVSVCKGLAMKKCTVSKACLVGVYFGGFQALMPLIGFILGVQFEDVITSIDHWIALNLLSLIDENMITGGVILILMGCKILLEHLGVIG